ncbi:thiopurine S-methyltransferase [Ferrimonas senticii]|uniref:thiopurine S-methyltransferase n=1 Tax=Ferrimonas senticii TaxID=394566 RepID=UPI00040713F1|nr:thiopurine S-methyltransferase [Ferrimonas senticii]
MEAAFWQHKWDNNQIGFHLDEINPQLSQFWPSLGLSSDARVLVPLCGKTLDIGWLLAQGHAVVAAELSEVAVSQLFKQLQLMPTISQHGNHRCYQAGQLTVWVGDLFELTAAQLGTIDAIYDRAALVALPEPMRQQYRHTLQQLVGNPPQLLLTLNYDQSQLTGPPFSLNQAELQRHYGADYQLTELHKFAEPGGLKGKLPALNQVWQLLPLQG